MDLVSTGEVWHGEIKSLGACKRYVFAAKEYFNLQNFGRIRGGKDAARGLRLVFDEVMTCSQTMHNHKTQAMALHTHTHRQAHAPIYIHAAHALATHTRHMRR